MANLNLQREKTALLSMDFHKLVVNACAMTRERNTVGNAAKALAAARSAGIPVLHVELHRFAGYASDRNKFQRTIRERIPAAPPEQMAELMKVVDELAPAPGEAIVHKSRINAFYASALDSLLRSKDIDTLALMGVTTENVIEATARQAADSDYRVIILEDCCAAFTDTDHKNSIGYLERIADIASADDFAQSL